MGSQIGHCFLLQEASLIAFLPLPGRTRSPTGPEHPRTGYGILTLECQGGDPWTGKRLG